MTLKKRIARLETALEPAVPLLTIDIDGKCYCGGDYDEHGNWYRKQTTREAWRAQYAEQIEREKRRYPNRIFAISFAPNDAEDESEEAPE